MVHCENALASAQVPDLDLVIIGACKRGTAGGGFEDKATESKEEGEEDL